MIRRPKLRTQVLAGVLSVTLLALVAFDIAAVGALHRYLAGRTGSDPVAVAQPLVATAYTVVATEQWRVAVARDGRDAVMRAAGRGPSSGRAPRAAGTPSAIPAPPLLIEHWFRPALRFRTAPGPSSGDVNATVGRFRLMVILGSAAAGLLICAGVVLIMRRGLRPIETMAAQTDRIAAGDLTHRIGCPSARSEVGRLATALNGMLTRIENDLAERAASQELMRRFFADASHELRTPLASLRANAELYQQGALRRRPQVDEAMRRIALEARRMSNLVDDMLRLARLDHGAAALAGQREPVDLAGLVKDRVANARVADPARRWHADVAGARVPVAGDEELLRRAVDNLLANVRTHTPPGTSASVTARARGGTATIEVSDDGPGVPASQLPHVFGRFHRAGAPAGRPGSGLGLSIVAEIAAVHGGVAEAALADPHGFRVIMSLPANAASTAHSRASAAV